MPYRKKPLANAPSRKYFSEASDEPRVAPREPGQDVQGKGKDLQAQEDDQKVVALGHGDHARARQENQRVIGPGLPREVGGPFQRQQDGQPGGDQDRGRGEDAEPIRERHALHVGRGRPQKEQSRQRTQDSQEAQPGEHGLIPDHQVGQQHEQAGCHEDDLRQDGQ